MHVPGRDPLNEDRWNDIAPNAFAQWSLEKKLSSNCSVKLQRHREVAARLRMSRLKDVFVLREVEEWLKNRR